MQDRPDQEPEIILPDEFEECQYPSSCGGYFNSEDRINTEPITLAGLEICTCDNCECGDIECKGECNNGKFCMDCGGPTLQLSESDRKERLLQGNILANEIIKMESPETGMYRAILTAGYDKDGKPDLETGIEEDGDYCSICLFLEDECWNFGEIFKVINIKDQGKMRQWPKVLVNEDQEESDA